MITEEQIRSIFQSITPHKKQLQPGQQAAAVLIPFVQDEKEISLLLTQRTEKVEHHKKQISFPGGAVDINDSSIIDTALRETEEELGIPPDIIEIIGSIDDVETPSRFLITPVVGILTSTPEIKLNTHEVEEAFSIPFSFFMDDNNVRLEQRMYEGRELPIYFYHYGERLVWGVTAHIIRILVNYVRMFK